jgi:hypothetical protein
MLRPMPIEPLPPETARIARAAYPKGNLYLRLADELDTLFTDDAFLGLFPPHLITHVETTTGPAADGAATPQIHAALQQRGLLPGTHIVDTGFLDAQLLVESRDDYGIDLLGTTRLDYHWQAREGAGFDAQHFQVDWDQQRATCPAGKRSISWTPAVDNRGNAVIKVNSRPRIVGAATN